MTGYQKAKRIALWRGSAIAASLFALLMMLSALAGHVTS